MSHSCVLEEKPNLEGLKEYLIDLGYSVRKESDGIYAIGVDCGISIYKDEKWDVVVTDYSGDVPEIAEYYPDLDLVLAIQIIQNVAKKCGLNADPLVCPWCQKQMKPTFDEKTKCEECQSVCKIDSN